MKKIFKALLTELSRFILLANRIKVFLIPTELQKKSKLENKIDENLVEETFQNFKEHFKKSVLFKDISQIREYAIKTSLLNDKQKDYYYLEFGVFKGTSTNFFSKYVNKFYAFDSFEGLKEDWIGTGDAKGSFNLDKQIPKLDTNVEPIIGWVENTLEDFLKKHNPKINFVHLDMDTYNPTKYTLEKLKPYLVKNAIIIFDELYNFIGWEQGEYKALKEVFNEDEFEYKGFNIKNKVNFIIY
ncbi:class I SAM-dependent methyltransferase [Candidatus Pelagibacter sp.]|nr:class I SAM-dependent methyltransferase [Candidatus Pelagibacter sp.]